MTMVDHLPADQLTELVRAIVSQLVSEPAPERLAFNLTEASALTGISEKQLRLAIARRELRGRRLGKSYRITRRALLDWIDSL